MIIFRRNKIYHLQYWDENSWKYITTGSYFKSYFNNLQEKSSTSFWMQLEKNLFLLYFIKIMYFTVNIFQDFYPTHDNSISIIVFTIAKVLLGGSNLISCSTGESWGKFGRHIKKKIYRASFLDNFPFNHFENELFYIIKTSIIVETMLRIIVSTICICIYINQKGQCY